MIRHYDQLEKMDAPLKAGKGHVLASLLLNDGEFAGKGRVFNHCILKPGCSVGKHRHVNDFEVYYILKGKGLYDDNGTLRDVVPGDVAICRDGEEHMLENNGTEDLEFIALILYS
ncbi:cupin domain-containing protein [uncultured Bilophila sp.]|uniref:cupin domain-containing protein n=1 Tax=uncultured Bilophila sp. TaxID=529385 RepID=UPI0025F6868E|nr:cupin domain-containing protein [uncultured Bilophila sp.]